MVPEAPLEQTETGLVATGEGWFVLNALEARWHHADGRGAKLIFDSEVEFPQVGINLFVLAPGEPMGMYHWEADQEDFLVLSGEAVLIVEGEERPLRQSPCAVLAVGARRRHEGGGWGGYTVDEVALRLGAGVTEATNDAKVAYAQLPVREPTRYRNGWLPER